MPQADGGSRWDELAFLPATLTRGVIEHYEPCDSRTVLGGRFARVPVELDIPLYIAPMGLGTLSPEEKVALAIGAAMAGSAIGSGEGGMLAGERERSTRWMYQLAPGGFGIDPHHLLLADAVEIVVGRRSWVGIANPYDAVDLPSPERHGDWLGPDDLALKIQELREATDYRVPIQLKIGASRVYEDVRMAAKCGPDSICLDGAEAGRYPGAPVTVTAAGIPLIAAVPEARRALEDVGLVDEVDLVVSGGIRTGADAAKVLALGANAVAVGTAPLSALRNSEIVGPDEEAEVERAMDGAGGLDIEAGAARVCDFLTAATTEVQSLARACGKTRIASLEPEDLTALTLETSALAKVPLAGSNYIPGATEQQALGELRDMLAQRLGGDAGQ